MCGRYTLYEPVVKLEQRFEVAAAHSGYHANYNVAPGQTMPVVIEDAGTRRLEPMRWGLIPNWSIDPKIGYKLINARDDTIFDKPLWRKVILQKRALILADGFYEWSQQTKQPYYIHPKHSDLFAFAGVWEIWHDSNNQTWKTFSIITTEPNKEMRTIHNRMPVILHHEDEASWLSQAIDNDRASIEILLRPYEEEGLVMYKVNATRNNNEKLIYPMQT
jgi:putative SOS response-associated peptidase YedK